MLLLDNTESTYKWLDSWSKNFKQKIKGGRFNLDKAESVVRKYLVPVARRSAGDYPHAHSKRKFKKKQPGGREGRKSSLQTLLKKGKLKRDYG